MLFELAVTNTMMKTIDKTRETLFFIKTPYQKNIIYVILQSSFQMAVISVLRIDLHKIIITSKYRNTSVHICSFYCRLLFRRPYVKVR